MPLKMNGNTTAWISRLLTGGVLLTILTLLLAQSKQEGIQETKIDSNTVIATKVDTNFNKFILQQTRKSIIDSMNTDAIIKLLNKQVEFNDKQTEFNEDVKEFIIKKENE